MRKFKDINALFAGRYFDREVISPCARSYLRYTLGLRNFVETICCAPDAM